MLMFCRIVFAQSSGTKTDKVMFHFAVVSCDWHFNTCYRQSRSATQRGLDVQLRLFLFVCLSV